MSSQDAPRRSWLFRLSNAVDTTMRACFYRLGYLVSGFPLRTIVAAFIVTGLALIGMLRFRSESRPGELWVPQGTVALKNQAYVEASYGRTVRAQTIAFVEKSGGTPLASQKGLLEMLDVAEAGYNVVAPAIDASEDGADGTDIFYEERCVETRDAATPTPNVLCRTISPFNLFYDVSLIATREGGRVDFFGTVRKKLNSMDDAEIRAVLENPPETSFDGSPFNAEELIGGTSGSGNSFRVKVMRYTQLSDNNAIVENGDLVDKEAKDLEEVWTNLLLENSPLLNGRTVEWFVESDYSQEESLSEALSGDLPLLSIGFVLLGIYVTFFLGDFHTVRSHMLLAIGAIATPGLALGVCFGLSSALGMFFGPVHQILPLLIIGIGIDDCFHVTRAVDEVNSRPGAQDKPVRQRIALALSQSGSAITVTSFTNVVVFLLSAISELPALRFFALWAAIGIFAAWGFAITFYAALLTFDTRRIDANRRDCCPCFSPLAEVKELNWFKKPAGGFSRFFKNTFGPFIMRPVVRAVILVLFAGMLGAGSYGTSQLYLKFRFAFFYPSGSAQREFQDVIDEYFKLGDPTNIYIRDVDLSLPENQRRLFDLCRPETGVIAKDSWIQGDSVDCWYVQFRELNDVKSDDGVVDQVSFAEKVIDFVNGPGGRYNESIVFNDDETKVMGCRFGAQYIYRETNVDEIDALESVRNSADSVGFGKAEDGTPLAFPYVFFDTFSEQYAALPGEIGLSLGLASGAVALVCLILVGHPLVALVSVVTVGIIIINVLGLTNFSGINLNSVSVITLVLTTGISVDFVVHIARSFLEQVGTRTERAVKALEVMGPPVFYAGFSTFLAIIVLSGATSYIFRVIFFGFLFLIIMGFLHGLIFVPLVLSLVGPPSFYLDEEDKKRAEEKLEEDAIGSGKGEEMAESSESSEQDSV